MKRKLLSVCLALFTVILMMPCIASAEETKTAYVSVYLEGEVQCVNEAVETADVNGNGIIDIDDALKEVSDIYEKPYITGDGGWGLCIFNLWGDESGAFGYYLNDEMAMNLADEITDGAYITVYSYQDKEGWSDRYAYFNEKNVCIDEGDNVTLTLKICSFDENWNPVPAPFKGAIVMDGDEEIGITDENGQITLSLKDGIHVITAYGSSESGITVPASAIVTVNGGNMDIISPYEPEADDSQEVDTPKTGISFALIITFVIAGLGLCMAVIIRKRY